MSEEEIALSQLSSDEPIAHESTPSASTADHPTKSTPYIPPRIDDHSYQTAVPELQILPQGRRTAKSRKTNL